MGMKKRVFYFLLILIISLFACESIDTKKAGFRIAIVTGGPRYSLEAINGAKELIKKYGAVKDGGIIEHITYSDNFVKEKDNIVKKIVALSKDPLVKAIIVNEAVAGTAEAFNKIRSRRPDILLLAADPQEPLGIIQEASDLVVSEDFISRGFTIPWVAKKMGAENLVYISFDRHLRLENVRVREEIMKKTCNDLGMNFYYKEAPDPLGFVGLAGLKDFINKKVPVWLGAYGEKTAFFCTSDAGAEPIISSLLKEHEGIFVESALPSPVTGYQRALLLDLSKTKSQKHLIQKVRLSIENNVALKRLGTWYYSHSASLSIALGEYAKQVIDGTTKKGNLAALENIMREYMPETKIRTSVYIDEKTKKRAENHMLIYSDTYVFGQGFIYTTEQAIPPKYQYVKIEKN